MKVRMGTDLLIVRGKILDTTIGTPAEQLYPKLGYKYLGVIPKYGIGPKTGNLVDEIFYYKDLRDEE